ncbi:MAG: hypothetical protein AB8I08_06325 [Sandaracinaceae bacterium]
MSRRRAIWATLAVLTTLVPATAYAHPEVDRAAAEVTNGNYEAAEPLLGALLERDDLDFAELTTVLELRAVLFRAMARETQLDTALRALAALAPEHRFGSRYPPDLEARAARVRASVLQVTVHTTSVPSAVGVRLSAEVQHDPDGLVRALRYRVFDAERAQWTVASPPVESAGRQVLAFVEAVGPGGAVVATSGSPDAPIRLRGLQIAAEPAEDHDDGWVPWVIGGVVLAVVAGLVIGLGVGLSEGASVTWQPGAPREVP